MRKPLSCLFALGLVFFLGAGVASAQFMASDLVYIPAAAHNDGTNDSHWRTDVFVTNVDTVAVDLAFFFLPTGTSSNLGYFLDRQYGLGGRPDEGWGHVYDSLADVQPGATVALDDIIGHEDSSNLSWLDDYGALAGVGAIVVFAYEAGTLDADGGPTPRNVVVMSRTYSLSTDGSTYGQLMPGIPWYNMADAGAVNDQHDLSYVVLPGARDNPDYRYNLGLLNASDDQTTIQLKVEVFKADGSAYTDDTGAALAKVATLGPLAHLQLNSILSSNFGLSDVRDVLIKVSFLSWTSTSPDPVPMFTAYGTLIDNSTNDATTILPSFGFPYDVNCMWGDGTPTTSLSVSHSGSELPRLRRRPVNLPPR